MSTKPMTKQFTVPDNLFKPKRSDDIAGPFTSVALRQTGKILGVKLPPAYVDVLKVRNGGWLLRTRFKLKQKPPKWLGSNTYHVAWLAGLHASHAQSLASMFRNAREAWGLDKGLVPFTDNVDGHSLLCLDYRASGTGSEPTVVHWEPDFVGDGKATTSRTHQIAASFEQLILGLQRDQQALEPAAISLDAAGVRGERLAKLLKSLGCTKYRYPGVKSSTALPPTWHWPTYRNFIRGLPVWLVLEKNKTYGHSTKFDERAKGHPILRVSVSPKQADRCLAELCAKLGPDAKLLQGVV